jgi:hypothetical protein
MVGRRRATPLCRASFCPAILPVGSLHRPLLRPATPVHRRKRATFPGDLTEKAPMTAAKVKKLDAIAKLFLNPAVI